MNLERACRRQEKIGKRNKKIKNISNKEKDKARALEIRKQREEKERLLEDN